MVIGTILLAATLQEFKDAGTTDMLNPKEKAVGYVEADTNKVKCLAKYACIFL